MFQLFNATDGILASERLFETVEEAAEGIKEWQEARLGRRNLPYLTSLGHRIEVHQVIIEIVQVEGH